MTSSFAVAIRGKFFWLLFLISICTGMNQVAILVHVVPHATDMGIPLTAAVSVLTVIGVANMAGRIGLGGIGDKIGSGSALALNFALVSAAMLILLFANQMWILTVFGVLYGLAAGGLVTLLSPAAASLFGMESHGLFLGVFEFAQGIGNSGGPVLAGFVYDALGGYEVAFVVLLLFGVLGIILSLRLARMKAPVAEELLLE